MSDLKDELFRQLVDAWPVPTNFVDRQGVVRYANQASVQLLGTSLEQIVGTPGAQLVSGGHRHVARQAIEAALAGESTEEEVDIASLSGPVRSVVVTVPVRDGRGVVGTFASAYVVDAAQRPLPAAAQLVEPLSARETEILALLRSGKHPKDIAQLLGISVFTARNHVRAVCRKYEVHSVVELLSRFTSPG